MKVDFMLIAKGSSIDLNVNTLSIFEIMDDLTIERVGNAQKVEFDLGYQLVISVERESGDGQGEVKKDYSLDLIEYSFDGKEELEKKTNSVPIYLSAQHKRSRLRFNLITKVNKNVLIRHLFKNDVGDVIGQRDLPISFK